MRCTGVSERDGISSDDLGVEPEKRVYRFVMTFEVEPEHEAYDDPEWAADAAWGALTNMYGLLSYYSDIEELDHSHRIT